MDCGPPDICEYDEECIVFGGDESKRIDGAVFEGTGTGIVTARCIMGGGGPE